MGGMESLAGNCERHLLFVFKELDLAKALFRLFFRLIRAAQILALFGKHFVTAGNFFDHAALPGNALLVNERSHCGQGAGATPYRTSLRTGARMDLR